MLVEQLFFELHTYRWDSSNTASASFSGTGSGTGSSSNGAAGGGGGGGRATVDGGVDFGNRWMAGISTNLSATGKVTTVAGCGDGFIAASKDARSELMGSKHGVLLEDMITFPDAVYGPLGTICRDAILLTATSKDLFLFVVRLASTIEDFALAALADDHGRSAKLDKLASRSELQQFLRGTALELLRAWLADAEKCDDLRGADRYWFAGRCSEEPSS